MLETMMVESSAKAWGEFVKVGPHWVVLCRYHFPARQVAQKVSESLARSHSGALDGSIVESSFCPLACVQVVFVLEQLILLAQEPVTFAKGDANNRGSTNQFFDANRKVCGDWFQRMRQLLQQTLHRYGSPQACYALTQARLVDALGTEKPGGERPQPLSELALMASRKSDTREVVLSTVSFLGGSLGENVFFGAWVRNIPFFG